MFALYCITVPAVLNDAVPAALHDVENELKHVLLDVSRYTGNGTSLHEQLDVWK